jgi:hypothetical protein
MKYIYTSNDEPIMSLDEQNIVVEWVKNNYKYFDNRNNNRYMQKLDYLKNVPKCIYDIKKRIFDKERLYEYKQEPTMRDSIGYMTDGGQLHVHRDPNMGELYHTRYNVYVQLPIIGGYPIYDDKVHKLKERTYICCRSGLDIHSCEMVKGPRARIVISFGLLLPIERIQNIIYDYLGDTIGHTNVKVVP